MKITIKDIAKEAKVSTATVSKVLNRKDHRISDQTRNLVLKIAKDKNYIPNSMARSLVTKKTNTIGLILPDITNPFFPELARGAEDKANEEGYMIMFCNTDDKAEKESKYLNMLAQKMIDGIILTQSANMEGNSKILNELKIPLVLIDRDIDIENVQGKVLVNNFEGAYNAVEYLIKKDRKKIAFITGPLSTTTSNDRLDGYKKGLIDNKIDINSKLILEGEYKGEWGTEATKILLEDKIEFDAIFCGNDLIAVSVIKTLKKFNLNIPNDVSVIGYDNIYLSEIVEPPLTTVNQPVYQMGYEAAGLLIDILEKKTKGKTIKLGTNLVIRETV
ncbi:MAG: LacI family DNA-binding transcriptional regulator [Bacillota bacterium]|nr:LacI family DNA-binding transcriptional regulator [Bacillota bacterium]